MLSALLLVACGQTNKNPEDEPTPASGGPTSGTAGAPTTQPEPSAPADCSNPAALVEFEDNDLEAAVRDLLNAPSGPSRFPSCKS